nr:hypothetical protein [Tanacetum cinerariifolium]
MCETTPRGKGKRKDDTSSKEVLFSKAAESPSETILEITSDSECDNQEPLPPLPKLSGAMPNGTSPRLIFLDDLTQSSFVFDKPKRVSDK